MATSAAPAHLAPKAVAYDEHSGFWSWIATVDHKRIGTLYLFTALSFFIIGGLEAVIIRAHLQHPNCTIV